MALGWLERSGCGLDSLVVVCVQKNEGPNRRICVFPPVFLLHVRHDVEMLLGHNFLNSSFNDVLSCPICSNTPMRTFLQFRLFTLLVFFEIIRPKALTLMPKENLPTNAEQIDPETNRKPTQHMDAIRNTFSFDFDRWGRKMTIFLFVLCS